MAKIEDILTVPIQLTDTLHSLAVEAGSYRTERLELDQKSQKLAKLLRIVARLANDATGGPLYMRPLRRMLQELEKSLGKALALFKKCIKTGVIKRVITIASGHDFKRVNTLLENSIANIAWFLTISATGDNRELVGGMPPITCSEPLLNFCWEKVATLYRGTEQEREEAAMGLFDYAKNNERFIKIMVEEEAVVPLLKVLADGTLDAREAAARTLGHMARDASTVKQMIGCNVAPVFVKVLQTAPMKVQAAVAWALAIMVEVDDEQQDLFLEHLAIRPLVALLGEGLEEPTKLEPAFTMHTLMTSMAANKAAGVSKESEKDQLVNVISKPPAFPLSQVVRNNIDKPSKSSGSPSKQSNAPRRIEATEPRSAHMPPRPVDNGRGLTQRELNRRERESADPELKEELKAQVARALWKLARGNSQACKSITETKALLCFATLMDKARGLVQLNCVMAVVEIAAVAENDVDLRRAAFKMSSPAAKAVVDQLLRLVDEGSYDVRLQVACIRAIGSLSRTFPARETRVVKPLVKQLEGPDEVVAEAVKALVKFACEENFLHNEHAKAIVEASGAAHLVQLIYFGKGDVQYAAVTLMCYLALYSGENEQLARAEPLPALKGFGKSGSLAQHPKLEILLSQAVNHLEIYHGRTLIDPSDPYSCD